LLVAGSGCRVLVAGCWSLVFLCKLLTIIYNSR
jgi:hypothetical protein